jgi:short-subunit dehydrogenase
MMKRNVLITGASSGIGKAIAYAFAENGDNLVITGRRFDKLEEIKHDIEKQFHVQVSIYSFDITNMEQTIINCQKIIEEVGQIHIFGKQCWPGIGIGQISRL